MEKERKEKSHGAGAVFLFSFLFPNPMWACHNLSASRRPAYLYFHFDLSPPMVENKGRPEKIMKKQAERSDEKKNIL